MSQHRLHTSYQKFVLSFTFIVPITLYNTRVDETTGTFGFSKKIEKR